APVDDDRLRVEAVRKEDRRQPLGNLLSLHGTALRRLRMSYPKRNRVTGFPQCSVFSHALGPLTAQPRRCCASRRRSAYLSASGCSASSAGTRLRAPYPSFKPPAASGGDGGKPPSVSSIQKRPLGAKQRISAERP